LQVDGVTVDLVGVKPNEYHQRGWGNDSQHHDWE
jgi:hypothetical protein